MEPSPTLQKEDIVRFSDGWVRKKEDLDGPPVADSPHPCKQKIFMFEAQNICREMLSHRLQHNVTLPKPEAFFSDLSMGEAEETETSANRRTIEQLHEISRAKCRDLTGQILRIVRKHVGSTFFLYDASLVRGKQLLMSKVLSWHDPHALLSSVYRWNLLYRDVAGKGGRHGGRYRRMSAGPLGDAVGFREDGRAISKVSSVGVRRGQFILPFD